MMKPVLGLTLSILLGAVSWAQDVSSHSFTPLTEAQTAIFASGWGWLEKVPMLDAKDLNGFSVMASQNSCDKTLYTVSDWSPPGMRTLFTEVPALGTAKGSHAFVQDGDQFYMIKSRQFSAPHIYRVDDVAAHKLSPTTLVVRYHQTSEWKGEEWTQTDFTPSYLVIEDVTFEDQPMKRSWTSIGPNLYEGSLTSYYLRCE